MFILIHKSLKFLHQNLFYKTIKRSILVKAIFNLKDETALSLEILMKFRRF